MAPSVLAGVFQSRPKSLGVMTSGTCFRRAKFTIEATTSYVW